MQLYPTRATFHVAIAGAAMVALGVALRIAPMVAFGGAMILAVAVGRAFALASVTRLRGAGFEMVWSTKGRVSRVARGEDLVLRAELRNRGTDDVRGLTIRPLVSSMLEATVEPLEIDLPAGSRATIDVRLKTPRVGRWGVHGMALEVRGIPVGGDALYEVPLMFANPHGVEVLPPSLQTFVASPRGGRARRTAEAGQRSTVRGEGDEFRELRGLVPGDAFKRIAWKASARRGLLLVRETEREERDRVVCVLDASVELWAGAPGTSPLDVAIDDVAAVLTKHLRRGHLTGLVVHASRTQAYLPPAEGAAHLGKMIDALVSAGATLDADRTEADERDVALRVMEHLRPLDPMGLTDVRRDDLEALASRADGLKHRAPFTARAPLAGSLREQRLRHYLGVFGVELGPRAEGERVNAEAEMSRVLLRLAAEKHPPNLVYVFGPAPDEGSAVEQALKKLRQKHTQVVWALPSHEGLRDVLDPIVRARPAAVLVREAVEMRAAAAEIRQRVDLRKLGVRIRPKRSVSESAPVSAPEKTP